MIFDILPNGNRRKVIKNEIPVKVVLDVDTVNIKDEYTIDEDVL